MDAVITGLKFSREVAIEQLRFFCEKDSVAEAKTDTSIIGGFFVGSSVDELGEVDSSGSYGDEDGVEVSRYVGCALSTEKALLRPFILGVRKE